jgi:addiction module HigA family antidote
VHPGEILREDVLPEIGLSVAAAAKALGVSRQMLHDILAQRRRLSAIMCLKVSRLLGSTPEFWMRLQAEYDLKKAAQNKKVMERIAQIVPVQRRRSPCLTICVARMPGKKAALPCLPAACTWPARDALVFARPRVSFKSV